MSLNFSSLRATSCFSSTRCEVRDCKRARDRSGYCKLHQVSHFLAIFKQSVIQSFGSLEAGLAKLEEHSGSEVSQHDLYNFFNFSNLPFSTESANNAVRALGNKRQNKSSYVMKLDTLRSCLNNPKEGYSSKEIRSKITQYRDPKPPEIALVFTFRLKTLCNDIKEAYSTICSDKTFCLNIFKVQNVLRQLSMNVKAKDLIKCMGGTFLPFYKFKQLWTGNLRVCLTEDCFSTAERNSKYCSAHSLNLNSKTTVKNLHMEVGNSSLKWNNRPSSAPKGPGFYNIRRIQSAKIKKRVNRNDLYL